LLSTGLAAQDGSSDLWKNEKAKTGKNIKIKTDVKLKLTLLKILLVNHICFYFCNFVSFILCMRKVKRIKCFFA